MIVMGIIAGAIVGHLTVEFVSALSKVYMSWAFNFQAAFAGAVIAYILMS